MPPILAAFTIVLLIIGGYVGAYLGMGERSDWWAQSEPPELATIERTYNQQWLRTAFKPAAWIESKVRGMEVQAVYQDPLAISILNCRVIYLEV